MTLVAPPIVNDVSYLTRINDEIHFAWPEREMLYFSIQNRLQDRTSKVSEAAGAR